MVQKSAARGGTDRAQDRLPVLPVVVLYGTGIGSWRERHGHIFETDAQLRWALEDRRQELIDAGALALFRGRLFAIEPLFSQILLDAAREGACGRRQSRWENAQRDANAATLG